MIRTVFYCDDDNDDLVMFEDVIRTIDPELVYKTSNDSEQALQLLLSGEIIPDVIFLDINMPKVNGIQMLESLKQDPRCTRIPILIYTTAAHTEDEKSFEAKGAAAVLRKIPELRESVHQVWEVLNRVLNSVSE
jgi:response regulator RpfG family c-di-GMP phosphodiesterase